MKAPFPYFGGKRTVAKIVWAALGNVNSYIEPFVGSGAVLLARPHKPSLEIVNDKDGFISNVWRAIQFSPDETAKWCDWPVNHADLMARRKVLLKNESMLLGNLVADDVWHDPKLAGYWIWAASCWIGSGLTRPNAIPRLTENAGVPAPGQIPQLSGNKGVHTSNSEIYSYFRQLSERLRRVKVVCGDWSRVCGGDWQDADGVCGIFFDPPYSDTDRDVGVYRHDCTETAQDVATWALERGAKPAYRIVIAGYDGEHPRLEQEGWTKQGWRTGGGYGNQGGEGSRGSKNRHREMLWFSPHCLTSLTLFAMEGI